MKSETMFRTIGQISDDAIMEANTEAAVPMTAKPVLHRAEIFKRKPSRTAMLRWGAAAACLVVALVITIPMLQRSGELPITETPTPDIAIGTSEWADLYGDLKIYYLDGENTIAFESFYTRYAPEDIFAKWAELNNVEGVTLVKYFLNSNGAETTHGDPNDPETIVSYTIGDYFTIDITLSSEYTRYAEGENGLHLAESMEKTFIGYHATVDIAEFNLIIAEP